MMKTLKNKRSKYVKIPKKIKLMFIKAIIQNDESIKNSAKFYNINYSTAKTFIRQFKNKELDVNLCEVLEEEEHAQNKKETSFEGRCGFKLIEVEKPNENDEKSTDGGNSQKRDDSWATGSCFSVQNSINKIQIISKVQFKSD